MGGRCLHLTEQNGVLQQNHNGETSQTICTTNTESKGKLNVTRQPQVKSNLKGTFRAMYIRICLERVCAISARGFSSREPSDVLN